MSVPPSIKSTEKIDTYKEKKKLDDKTNITYKTNNFRFFYIFCRQEGEVYLYLRIIDLNIPHEIYSFICKHSVFFFYDLINFFRSR
jgi:hypothetical protein